MIITLAMAFDRLRQWLAGQSFRTGIIVVALCAACYAVSFAQILLPISTATKGILWTVFFGLAKTFQYSALLILGSAGMARVKNIFKRRR